MGAVAIVRRKAGGVRTGHAGTLDPLATGVLVIAVGGRATRHIAQVMATDKAYLTSIDLSAFSATDDLEGERTAVAVEQPPTMERVRAELARFVGSIRQRPPMYSAMKVGGRRAYKLARRGQPVHIEPRQVVVRSLELMRYEWPRVDLGIRCGKGFYVRSLARDLGQALGTGGHCAAIRRTAVGPFTLDMARRLDDLPEKLTSDDLMPIEAALAMITG